MEFNNTTSLTDLNNEGAKKYYGFIVFICVLFIPGIVGNLHILHVYIFRKKDNNTRFYVLFIAVLDMINCLVCFPFQVVNCLHPYMFYSDIACKVFSFITYFVNICVPLGLLVISVDRYRAICYPFRAQISKRLSKMLCAIMCTVSLILSIPCFVLSRSVNIDTEVNNIIGKECNLSTDFGTWLVIYLSGLSILTIAEAVVLIVIYSLMGWAIRKHEILVKKSGLRDNVLSRSVEGKKEKASDVLEINKIRRTQTLPPTFKPSWETENEINISSVKHEEVTSSRNDQEVVGILNDIRKHEILIKKSGLRDKVPSRSVEMKSSKNDQEVVGILNEIKSVSISDTQNNTNNGWTSNELHKVNEPSPSDKQLNLLIKDSEMDLIYHGLTITMNKMSSEEKIHFNNLQSLDTLTFKELGPDINENTTFDQPQHKSRVFTLQDELNISPRTNPLFSNKSESSQSIESFLVKKRRQMIKIKQDKETFKRTKRITIMFFWITFVYLVSCLPNPALRVVRFFQPEWYTNMSFAGQTIYHLVIGSVFLVSATNFFIYLFCDSMFRREIHQWYRHVFCRCRREL